MEIEMYGILLKDGFLVTAKVLCALLLWIGLPNAEALNERMTEVVEISEKYELDPIAMTAVVIALDEANKFDTPLNDYGKELKGWLAHYDGDYTNSLCALAKGYECDVSPEFSYSYETIGEERFNSFTVVWSYNELLTTLSDARGSDFIKSGTSKPGDSNRKSAVRKTKPNGAPHRGSVKFETSR